MGAEFIAAMGDGFVLMHGMVKKLSNPEVIQFLEKLQAVIAGPPAVGNGVA